MALVPAALLWVLSRHRRKDDVRAWVAVWLCHAGPLFVISAGIFNLTPPRWARRPRVESRRRSDQRAHLARRQALLALSAAWIAVRQWP